MPFPRFKDDPAAFTIGTDHPFHSSHRYSDGDPQPDNFIKGWEFGDGLGRITWEHESRLLGARPGDVRPGDGVGYGIAIGYGIATSGSRRYGEGGGDLCYIVP